VRRPSFVVGPLVHETLQAVFRYNHSYVSNALSDFPVPRCYEEHGHRGALYAELHLACNLLLSHKVRECLRWRQLLRGPSAHRQPLQMPL